MLQPNSQIGVPDRVLLSFDLASPMLSTVHLVVSLSLAPFLAHCPSLFDLSFPWSPSPLAWRTESQLEVGREEERGMWREGGVCLAQVGTCHQSPLIIYDVSCFSKHFPINYY